MTESTPVSQPAKSTSPGPDATPEELEADIAASRERLGAAVEDLVERLNVPGRARQKAQQASGQAKQATASLVDRLKDLPPVVLLASGGGLAARVIWVIVKRRR